MSRLNLGNLYFNISANSTNFDETLNRTERRAGLWAVSIATALGYAAAKSVKAFSSMDDALTRSLARFENINKDMTGDFVKGINDLGTAIGQLAPASIQAFDESSNSAKVFNDRINDLTDSLGRTKSSLASLPDTLNNLDLSSLTSLPDTLNNLDLSSLKIPEIPTPTPIIIPLIIDTAKTVNTVNASVSKGIGKDFIKSTDKEIPDILKKGSNKNVSISTLDLANSKDRIIPTIGIKEEPISLEKRSDIFQGIGESKQLQDYQENFKNYFAKIKMEFKDNAIFEKSSLDISNSISGIGKDATFGNLGKGVSKDLEYIKDTIVDRFGESIDNILSTIDADNNKANTIYNGNNLASIPKQEPINLPKVIPEPIALPKREPELLPLPTADNLLFTNPKIPGRMTPKLPESIHLPTAPEPIPLPKVIPELIPVPKQAVIPFPKQEPIALPKVIPEPIALPKQEPKLIPVPKQVIIPLPKVITPKTIPEPIALPRPIPELIPLPKQQEPEVIHLPRIIEGEGKGGILSNQGKLKYKGLENLLDNITAGINKTRGKTTQMILGDMSKDISKYINSIGQNALSTGSSVGNTLASAGSIISSGLGSLIPTSLSSKLTTSVSGVITTLKNELPKISKIGTQIAGDIANQFNKIGDFDYLAEYKKRMSQQARNLSINSLSTPINLSKAFTPAFQAGFGFEEATKALPIAERFAVVNNIDVSKSMEHLTQIMSSLQMAADTTAASMTSLARISAVVSMGASFGKFESVEQLAKSIEIKGATAAVRLGMSIEEITSAMLALSDAGLKGNQAGLVFETLSRQIDIAATKNKGIWEAMGISVFDANNKLLSMVDIISLLKSRWDSFGDNDFAKLTMAKELGINQKTFGNVVQGMSIQGGFGKYTKALEGAFSGQFDTKMYEKILVSFASQFQQFKNIIEVVGIEIGEMLAPVLSKITENIRGFINSWLDLDPAIKTVIGTIGMTFAGLLVFSAGIKLIGGIISLVGFAFSSILLPITAIGVAFGLLGSAISIAFSGISFLVNWFIHDIQLLYSITYSVVSGMVTVFKYMAIGIYTAFTATFMGTYWFITNLGSAFKMVGGWFMSVANLIGNTAATIYKTMIYLVSNIVTGITSLLISTIAGIASFIIGLVASIATLAVSIAILLPAIAAIGAIGATLGIGLIQGIGALGAGLTAVWQGIKNGWSNTSKVITGSMKEIGNAGVGMWDRAKEGTKNFFENTKGFIRNTIGFLYNFQDNITVIMDFIGTHWESIVEDMGAATIAMLENLSYNYVQFKYMIMEVMGSAFKVIAGLFYTYTSPIFAWFRDNWKNMLEDMGTLMKSFLSSIISNFKVILPLIAKGLWDASLGKDELQDKLNANENKLDRSLRQTRSIFPEENDKEPGNKESREKNESIAVKIYYDEKFKIKDDYKIKQAEWMGKLKGPFDDLDLSDLKTNPGNFVQDMKDSNTAAMSLLKITGTSISNSFAMMFTKFKSPLEGFEAKTPAFPTDKLKFDTPRYIIPEQAAAAVTMPAMGGGLDTGFMAAALAQGSPKSMLTSIMDILKKQGLYHVTEPGKEAGPMSGAKMPGEFKEISLRRYLLDDGPTAETKIQQVEDKKLAKELIEMRKAIEITKPAPPVIPGLTR